MFRHVLVPLDGSHLAEAALPPAASVAAQLGASVTLIHLIEHRPPESIHSDRHLSDVDEATAYLAELARTAFPPHLNVRAHVHSAEVNDVARSIVDHTDELEPDLIVMCTHGRGGARHLVFGTIAQQVIAMGTTPVLLIRPEVQERTTDFLRTRILVPLDHHPEHARCLPYAAGLAKPFGVPIHLLSVIPTFETLAGYEAATGRLLPSATRAMLDIDRDNTQNYLEDEARAVREDRIEVETSVARGDPATQIVEVGAQIGAGLIVMGVHGTLGSEAFWERSVPPKVSARSKIPVLFVPIRDR
ncbi:MAG: universal stress protein [Anaerolineales bacterium]|nr:universal stress protein [Anaerolineales bacterium]